MIPKSETLAQLSERNRDFEIATCPANHPDIPLRLQSRFRNRGSFPRLRSRLRFRRWGIAAIALLFSGICHADRDTPKQVRVCVQYIEMAHPLLTELLDGGDTSGYALHAKAMEHAKKGEAKILETAMVVCRSGQNAAATGILEEIYPTEFESPYREIYGGNSGIAFPGPIDPFRRSRTAFETRNTGMNFQVEANVGNTPLKVIELRFSPEFVRRVRLDSWLEHSDQWGTVSFLTPVYEKWGAEGWVTLSSGQFELTSVITPKTQSPPPAVSKRVLLFVRADILESPSPP